MLCHILEHLPNTGRAFSRRQCTYISSYGFQPLAKFRRTTRATPSNFLFPKLQSSALHPDNRKRETVLRSNAPLQRPRPLFLPRETYYVLTRGARSRTHHACRYPATLAPPAALRPRCGCARLYLPNGYPDSGIHTNIRSQTPRGCGGPCPFRPLDARLAGALYALRIRPYASLESYERSHHRRTYLLCAVAASRKNSRSAYCGSDPGQSAAATFGHLGVFTLPFLCLASPHRPSCRPCSYIAPHFGLLHRTKPRLWHYAGLYRKISLHGNGSGRVAFRLTDGAWFHQPY